MNTLKIEHIKHTKNQHHTIWKRQNIETSYCRRITETVYQGRRSEKIVGLKGMRVKPAAGYCWGKSWQKL